VILPRFELKQPTTVREACEILKNSENVKIIAGGTDLLVNLKKKVINADVLVSLAKIEKLKKVTFTQRNGISIGPLVTIDEVSSSPVITKNYPVLSIAAGKLGSPQIRNRATIGGNICTARPAGDTIGPLIACEAVVEISSAKGDRKAPIETIFKGPGQTTVAKDEILTGISMKKLAENTGCSYIKYMIRNAMEIALVSVTALVAIENGTCRSARIVLGAVGPTFIRCKATEEFLTGKKITAAIAEKAGQYAGEICTPITDTRASADYRRRLVEILAKRAISEAYSSVSITK
jgi:xanthine dehydrogenase FAD-binding subunit